MSGRRRPATTKRFGDVIVQPVRHHEPAAKRGMGSRVRHGELTWELPQWPARINDVQEHEGGGLVVTTNNGARQKLLTPDTAIRESSAGGSMGGQDPRKHGKIRYIVRAFGEWANGKQSTCVRVINTKHPEILKPGQDANGLCAWLKDQWAGTTKWRGSSKDPKQVTQDAAIRAKATAAHEARFTAGMPELSDEQLDGLVESVRKLTGIEPVDILAELHVEEQLEEAAAPTQAQRKEHATVVRKVAGGEDSHKFPIWNKESARSALKLLNHSDLTAAEKQRVRNKAAEYLEVDFDSGDAFARIYEFDAAWSSQCVAETVAQITDALEHREAARYAPLMERWLALHGDVGAVREDAGAIEQALQRAVLLASDPDPWPRRGSAVEVRVTEAAKGIYEPEEQALATVAESTISTVTLPDRFESEQVEEGDARDPLADYLAPEQLQTTIREADLDADEESYSPWVMQSARRSHPWLLDRAMETYRGLDGSTRDGERLIRESSAIQLAEIIETLCEGDYPWEAGGQSAGRIKTASAHGATAPGASRGQSTAEDDRLDAMLAKSGESMARFKRSLAARVDRDRRRARLSSPVPLMESDDSHKDSDLWEKCKREAVKKAGKHSAYAMSHANALYRNRGGEYHGKKPKRDALTKATRSIEGADQRALEAARELTETWSDEARAAALAARRSHRHGGGLHEVRHRIGEFHKHRTTFGDHVAAGGIPTSARFGHLIGGSAENLRRAVLATEPHHLSALTHSEREIVKTAAVTHHGGQVSREASEEGSRVHRLISGLPKRNIAHLRAVTKS